MWLSCCLFEQMLLCSCVTQEGHIFFLSCGVVALEVQVKTTLPILFLPFYTITQGNLAQLDGTLKTRLPPTVTPPMW